MYFVLFLLFLFFFFGFPFFFLKSWGWIIVTTYTRQVCPRSMQTLIVDFNRWDSIGVEEPVSSL